MKTIKCLLLLILVTVSFSILAENTSTSSTKESHIVETNLNSGIPVVVTNTIFEAKALEPHGMLITVTYEEDYRGDGRGFPTNGCIVAEASGPQSSTFPYWLAPRAPDTFKVSLRDENGLEASFTEQGKHFGKATTTLHNPLYNPNILFFTGTNDLDELVHFDIDDVFCIRHSGNYELELTPQLCWCSNLNAETFYLTNLPPVKLKIPLKSNVKGSVLEK